jgi:hypothetical protein
MELRSAVIGVPGCPRKWSTYKHNILARSFTRVLYRTMLSILGFFPMVGVCINTLINLISDQWFVLETTL